MVHAGRADQAGAAANETLLYISLPPCTWYLPGDMVPYNVPEDLNVQMSQKLC